MSAVELGPIVKSIDVRRSAADAFALFTNDIGKWWPIKTHSRAKDAAGEKTVDVTFEPRVGGRIFETLNTGETRDWGEVLAYEPGVRALFSFEMGRPKEKSGEVEVRFEPLDDASCRVVLTHAHWERLGEEAQDMRAAYAGGWVHVFEECFGDYAGTI
ncbi:MAG: hypothetical protein PVI23_08505 [Maricaulaceae bacterium]|jgi:uncharacterized protein YndB with AHSA1/START domain